MYPLKIKYEDFFNAVPDMTENHLNNAIPAAAADKLIAAHDGDVALLYIYYTRTGCTDPEQAAHDPYPIKGSQPLPDA